MICPANQYLLASSHIFSNTFIHKFLILFPPFYSILFYSIPFHSTPYRDENQGMEPLMGGAMDLMNQGIPGMPGVHPGHNVPGDYH